MACPPPAHRRDSRLGVAEEVHHNTNFHNNSSINRNSRLLLKDFLLGRHLLLDSNLISNISMRDLPHLWGSHSRCTQEGLDSRRRCRQGSEHHNSQGRRKDFPARLLVLLQGLRGTRHQVHHRLDL